MQKQAGQICFPPVTHSPLAFAYIKRKYKFPANKKHLILSFRTAWSSDSLSWKTSNPIGASSMEYSTATIQTVLEIALD